MVKTLDNLPRHGRVRVVAAEEEGRAPPAHLNPHRSALVVEPLQELLEVVAKVSRHRASRRGQDPAKEPHRAQPRLLVVVLQLVHDDRPDGDERGGVDHGYGFEDVGVPLAQRVVTRAPCVERVSEEVLHRELKVVLALPHQVARERVRRRVLAPHRLDEPLQHRVQHLRGRRLVLFDHDGEDLGHVLLHQPGVGRVQRVKQRLKQLWHQRICTLAFQVEHGHAQADSGDVLQQRVRTLERGLGRVLQVREGVQERDVDTLENEVVLIRVLGGEDAQDVAEAERGIEAHLLLLVLEQGGGDELPR